MIWTNEQRSCRRHAAGVDDQRDRFSRDRDRILYSSAFHRLAGVTQIVRAGEEDVFHTREQHSIKVAQIGRRIAEYCLFTDKKRALEVGLNPEVVEAACLAHDLGHPPFGHAGEDVLDRLVQTVGKQQDGKGGETDGFEGNAQTFRILTKLSVRHPRCNGLDLTRATLAAVLKYPWMRDHNNPNKSKKWSAYRTEKQDFIFAREFQTHDFKTAEAEIMDFADDIAYSVHDLEDFHRCNAVPWHIVFRDDEKEKIISNTSQAWHNKPATASDDLEHAMSGLKNLFLIHEKILLEPYIGNREQRQWLRNLTSQLIGRFLRAVSLQEGDQAIKIDSVNQAEVLLLKQITRDYIFTSPALSAQQAGHARLIEDLFRKIYDSCCNDSWPRFLPHRLSYLWGLSKEEDICTDPKARFAADCIASLTENEVVGIHSRLFGRSSGSVLHPIVR